jgi:oxygen-independent coproporphyrinogen-3 oxidase
MVFRHVYVHVPFCRRRCVYCDFSIAVRRAVPHGRYVAAIQAEFTSRTAALEAPEHGPDTIYFGGGTPSLLEPSALESLLTLLRSWRRDDGRPVEVTLEANPEDVTPERAAAWAVAGVSRVSLGVQSFQPSVLEWMHRSHGPDAASTAVQALREAGVTSISVDLIIGVPDAAGPDLAADLGRLLALDPDHVSAYTLTIEPKTPFGRWAARGLVEPAPDEQHASEFLQVHEVLTQAGFEHYEVSNYARQGSRARHNSSYWIGRPYLGLGPSAHSFDGAVRSWNVSPWAAYERLVFADRAATEESEILTGGQLLLERVYLGLRTAAGLRLNELPWPSPAGDQAVERGWARVDNGRLQLTPEGWLRLDAIASALTTEA